MAQRITLISAVFHGSYDSEIPEIKIRGKKLEEMGFGMLDSFIVIYDEDKKGELLIKRIEDEERWALECG